MSALDRLLMGYLDRDLSAEDAARLRDALADPAARERFVDLARHERRLRALLAPSTARAWSPPAELVVARRRRPARIAAALFALAAMVALAVRLATPLASSPRVRHAALATRADGSAIAVGDRVAPDEALSVAAGGALVVGWRDGTAVECAEGTSVAAIGADGLRLERGAITVRCAKRATGAAFAVATPDARVEVVGTRFRVAVGADGTDLAVAEGRVRFAPSAEAPREVAAGGSAHAAPAANVDDDPATRDAAFALTADAGVEADANGRVARWRDAAHGIDAAQPDAASRPVLGFDAVGNRTVRFAQDRELDAPLPIAGAERLTIALASSAETDDDAGEPAGARGAYHAALSWDEDERWCQTYLVPLGSNVRWRFGTGQRLNAPGWRRAAAIGARPSITTVVKDGAHEELWVDGERVAAIDDRVPRIDHVGPTLRIGSDGRRLGADWSFAGDIAAIAVWRRALSADEIAALHRRWRERYRVP